MNFQHVVGDGQQLRHRTERHAFEIQVQTSHYHTDTIVCQLVAHIDYAIVEKLSLINSNHIAVARQQQDALGRIHRSGRDGIALMRHHIVIAVADVNAWLENLNLLMGKLGTTHAADQLLGLTREHRTANHLYPATAQHLTIPVTYFFHNCPCVENAKINNYMNKSKPQILLYKKNSAIVSGVFPGF